MKSFVFDEWLWSDLKGDNETEAQSESFKLLQAIFDRCDRLVTVEGSPFLKKFFDLAEQARTGDVRREIVKMFRALFFFNSMKLHRLKQEDLKPMPDEMESEVKPDDTYLVRAYIASQADLLVTTDNPLMEVLKKHNVECQSRAAFIREYLST